MNKRPRPDNPERMKAIAPLYFENITYAEIAEKVGISVSTLQRILRDQNFKYFYSYYKRERLKSDAINEATTNTTPPPVTPTWTRYAPYKKGDVVRYDKRIYQCVQNISAYTTHEPHVSPRWREIT